MVTHCFISPYSQAPAAWRAAFPQAIVCSSPNQIPRDSQLTWIHLDNNSIDIKQKIALIQTIAPRTTLIVLSNSPQDEQGLLALELWAKAYAHALSPAQTLQQIADVVTRNGLWVGGNLLKRLLLAAPSVRTQAETIQFARLSPREQAVARAIVHGASNKEIAEQLHISERTVKAHLSVLFEKLQVRDRLQLALSLKPYMDTRTEKS